MKIVEK